MSKQPAQPESINDKIQAAYDEAKRTGTRRRIRINKAAFLEENPEAADDPRIAMTGDTMVIDFERNEETTAGELRLLCRANMDHPLARMKLMSVSRLPDDHPIVVLKNDLESIRSGKAIVSASPGIELPVNDEMPIKTFESTSEPMKLPLSPDAAGKVEGNLVTNTDGTETIRTELDTSAPTLPIKSELSP